MSQLIIVLLVDMFISLQHSTLNRFKHHIIIGHSLTRGHKIMYRYMHGFEGKSNILHINYLDTGDKLEQFQGRQFLTRWGFF